MGWQKGKGLGTGKQMRGEAGMVAGMQQQTHPPEPQTSSSPARPFPIRLRGAGVCMVWLAAVAVVWGQALLAVVGGPRAGK